MSDDKGLAVTDTIEIDGKKVKDGAIRQMIIDGRKNIDEQFRNVAKLLFVVYERSLFTRWGFKNFEEYTNSDLGFSYRKANYLIKIWDWYTNHVSRQDVMDAIWQEIGWTKAKEMVGIITDDNADEWLEKARTMNAIELAETCRKYLKALQGGDGGGENTGANETPDKTLSFKLTPSQKANVDEAIALASKASSSEKKGHNLDLICTNFIATNAESITRDAADFLGTVEKQYGFQILAVRSSDGTVVHGREVYDAVLEDARKEAKEKLADQIRAEVMNDLSNGKPDADA
jgi:hypothetical protein